MDESKEAAVKENSSEKVAVGQKKLEAFESVEDAIAGLRAE